MNKTIIYYTCNTHDQKIDNLCREYLAKVKLPIISVSLNYDLLFGDVRLTVSGTRSPLMMHKQIVMGLEACETKYSFLVESDVVYHSSHFDFNPERDDVYYFNTNIWKYRWGDGLCVWTDNTQQVSGMIAPTAVLLDFFKKRVEQIEKEGFDRHYEPRDRERVNYQSEVPNICIRHDNNITKSKWSIDDYRNKKYAQGWKELDNVPGWDMSIFNI